MSVNSLPLPITHADPPSSMLQSHEEKEKKFTIEMSWCGKETGNIHRAVAPHVVQEAMRIGQQKLDEADE